MNQWYNYRVRGTILTALDSDEIKGATLYFVKGKMGDANLDRSVVLEKPESFRSAPNGLSFIEDFEADVLELELGVSKDDAADLLDNDIDEIFAQLVTESGIQLAKVENVTLEVRDDDGDGQPDAPDDLHRSN